MSGTVKGLIAGVISIAVIGGGLIALNLTEPKQEVSDSSSSDVEVASLEIYSGDKKDVKSISVENENGGYKFLRVKEATETEAGEYTIEELDGVALDTVLLENMPVNAASLTAEKLIEENAADMSKYGFDTPTAEVRIEFDGENAQTVDLIVGDDTPEGNVYVALKNSKDVYSVSSSFISAYAYEKEYFVSLVCVEEPSEEDYPIVQSVTVQRKDLEQDIVFEYDPYLDGEEEQGGTTATHIMTSPVEAYLDVSDSVNYTHGIFGLRASGVLSISPTEDELAIAGITNPLCIVTTVLEDGTSYVLKIGAEYGEEGNTGYTGYLEGTDILWQFSKSSVLWADMKPEDAMASMIFGTYIYDISGLTIETEDTTRTFRFEGDSADNYKVMLDGKEYDNLRYTKFYQSLISAPAEEIYLDELTDNKRLAAVTIEKNNGRPDETVEFYEADNRQVIIKKNGKVSFRCRLSYLTNALLPNIEKLDTQEEFVTNW